MANQNKNVDELAACIRKCKKDDLACVRQCEADYVGGRVTVVPEGGKVFVDPSGGKVFVTHGGKVF